MLLDALTAVIDELVCSEPASLADADTVIELHRQLDRLQAAVTRVTGAFDTEGGWQLDRARNAAQWIAVKCHRAQSMAKGEVALARAMRHLPEAEDAWSVGDISAEHVRILAKVRRPGLEARLAEDEATLVGHAKELTFHQFAKIVAYWAQCADPKGDEELFEDQQEQRRFHLSRSFGDMWFGDTVLDPIGGAIVDNEISRIEKEMFEADWSAAKERLGREPTVLELGRTPPQRRADALVEMAVRSATAPADGRRPAPLFTVVVGWETLKGRICELADGTVQSPAALIPWLDTAWLERVVFDGPSRVLDVGVTRRLFVGGTRRAIEVRDQYCFHEFCEVPACDCQADHIVPFEAGGPTSQDNGRMACGFHNRDRNRPPPETRPD